MAVRQTWQCNAPSGNAGGLIMGEPADIKGRRLAGGLPWWLDSDASSRLMIGDTVAGGRSGIAMPGIFRGGWGLENQVVSSGPIITVIPDNTVIRCNTGLNSVTVQLPAAATMLDQILHVSKENAPNLVTILPNGAELINAYTSYVLTGLRQGVFLRSNGTSWDMLTQVGRFNSIFNDYNFAFTTTSGTPQTVKTSGAIYFTGRPVLFLLSASLSDINGFDEFMIAPQYLQFDGAGTNYLMADWSTNKANDHRHVSGQFLYIPPVSGFQGTHTISWNTNRGAGVGTLTIDTNDFVSLVSIEL